MLSCLFILGLVLLRASEESIPWWIPQENKERKPAAPKPKPRPIPSENDHETSERENHPPPAPPPEYEVPRNEWRIPTALSFSEPLAPELKPEDIVIFSGGHEIARRLLGHGLISATSIQDFAAHNRYNFVFLDQLPYNQTLSYQGLNFTGHWQRVFALPVLRGAFPRAKYLVWLDDDILIPHPETHMLNHYINIMHGDPEWFMTFAEEGGSFVLNSGLIIMRNRDFVQDLYMEAIDLAVKLRLNNRFGHEQQAIAMLREEKKLHKNIRVLPHREGTYNFNTFARSAPQDPPGAKAQFGDAFVHFLGTTAFDKERLMLEWLLKKEYWIREVVVPLKLKLPLGS